MVILFLFVNNKKGSVDVRLSHNLFSLAIYGNYSNAVDKSSKAMRKMASGLKIQSAKDNPNKIAANENLKIRILSNQAAQKNIQDTNSLLQTFDGSMQEINNSLSRLKQLTVQAANGTLQPEDKSKTQLEIDSLLNDIDYLAKNTQFNGVKLTDGKGDIIKSQIGSMEDEYIEIPKCDLTIANLFPNGIDTTTSHATASKAISDVDKAISTVTQVRAHYGAMQLKLENTTEYSTGINESLQKAQSSIGDVDVAEEILKYSQEQIKVKSSIALMAQSNKIPENALEILKNMR